MTRTTKGNDRNHTGLADGTATLEDHLPRYFAKSGHIDAAPNKVKKEGSGGRNWGKDGEEVHDYNFKFTNQRRRSNSSTNALNDFKTKFEAVERDPDFDESIHGPLFEDPDDMNLEKSDSIESGSTLAESIDEEHELKK